MTGTSKKFVCDECGKRCKSARGLTQHKKAHNDENIIPLNEEEKKQKQKGCAFCGDFIEFKNYKRHFRRCHKKRFFKIFSGFLDFLYKLIIFFNRENDNDNNLRFENEKKYFVYQEKLKNCNNESEIKKIEEELKTEKNYIKKNYEIYRKVQKQFNSEKIEEKKRILNDLQLNENIENYKEINKLIDIIFIAQRNEMPGISFRQIIFDYLKENDVENKLIIKKINRKYKKNDFPTNDEIKKIDENIAAKINDLMLTSSKYDSAYKKYYKMIQDFANNKLKNRCIFCGKFSLYKFKHFKKCKIFKNKFENNPYLAINTFLNNFYGKEKMNKVPNSYTNLVKKYAEINDFNYFIKNINKNILYYNDFIKNEEEEKNNQDIKIIVNGENEINYIKTNKKTNNEIEKNFFFLKRKKLNEILFRIIFKIEVFHNIKIDDIRKNYLICKIKNYFGKNHELNEDKLIEDFLKMFKNNEKIYEENNEEEESEENNEEINKKIKDYEEEINELEMIYGKKDKEKDEKIEEINKKINELKKKLKNNNDEKEFEEMSFNEKILNLINKNEKEINKINIKKEQEPENDILEKKSIIEKNEEDEEDEEINENIKTIENFQLLYKRNIYELRKNLLGKKRKKPEKYIIKNNK